MYYCHKEDTHPHLGIPFNWCLDTEFKPRGLIEYYFYDFLKGSKTKKRITPTIQCYANFTWLRKCERCNKVSTPRKIQYHFFFGYLSWKGEHKEYEIEHKSGWFCYI